jgi:hypothetical protein
MKDNKSRGTVTVGTGTNTPREVEIQDFVQATYKNNRVISVVGLEEEQGLILSVENPASTGRATKSTMWLSEESVLGLVSTVMLYFSAKGQNMEHLLRDAITKESLEYTYSDNLREVDLGHKD